MFEPQLSDWIHFPALSRRSGSVTASALIHAQVLTATINTFHQCWSRQEKSFLLYYTLGKILEKSEPKHNST